MYQEIDWLENRAQIKRRLLFLCLPAVPLLLGIILSFIARIEWLTVLLTILFGAILIFGYGLFLSPVVSYGKHIRNMLEGRKRETVGILTAVDSTPCWREGVSYYSFTVNVGEKTEEADDRLFYFDVQKGVPPFEIGTRLRVISHDKAVADMVQVTDAGLEERP